MLRIFLSILLVTLVILAFNKTTVEKLITKKTAPKARVVRKTKPPKGPPKKPKKPKSAKDRAMGDIQNRTKKLLLKLKPIMGVNKQGYQELSTSLKEAVGKLNNAWDMHPGNHNCMHKIDLLLDKVKDVYNTFKSIEIPLTDENPELMVWQSAIKDIEELLSDIVGFGHGLCSIKRIGDMISADVKPSETNGPLPGYEYQSYAENQYN